MSIHLVGKEVNHCLYGWGKVVSSNSRTFFVKYKDGSKKAYAYPQDFEDFLEIKDKNLKRYIDIDLDFSNGHLVKYCVEGNCCFPEAVSNNSVKELKAAEIKELKVGDCLGKDAKQIYSDLCGNPYFNWYSSNIKDSNKSSKCVKHATLEGYDVTFYDVDIASPVNQDNFIGMTWEAKQTNVPSEVAGDRKHLFLKNKTGQYLYWGLFEVVKTRDKDGEYEIVHKLIRS